VSKGEGVPGKEIFVEFVIMGNTVKVTAIDSESGLEASVIGPAGAPRAALADAARRKLEYLAKKKS
jgi:uncharacterized protein DUF6898